MSNTCGACDNPATHIRQRHATPTELEHFRNDPNNPSVQANDTEALVPVRGCDTHALKPELAAKIHDAHCAAPPACDCTASNP